MTVTGNVQAGSVSIGAIDPSTISDLDYRGTCFLGTAGETLTAGQIVALRNSSGAAKWYKYSGATADTDKLLYAKAIVVVGAASGSAATLMIDGFYRNDTVFTAWTNNQDEGKTVYASNTTDGGVMLSAPANSGDEAVILGWVQNAGASDTKIIAFFPKRGFTEK
jgi:hypothetical protein